MCRRHVPIDPHANHADLDIVSSFPRGAIGVGAVLSTMAVYMRNDFANYKDTLEESSTLKGIQYLLLLLVILKHHEYLLKRIGENLRGISARMRKILKQSNNMSSTALKKSLSSAEALCRLSRVSSSETIKKLSSTIRDTIKSYRKKAALKAITRPECFAKLDYIGHLSMRDMVILFRYVNDVNQEDFQKKQFMMHQSQLVRSIVTAMDMAVTMSKGGRPHSKLDAGGRKNGEVDALYFAAVTRIFAEWRTLRLVPKGYNRYAIGLNLAYRDVLQNLTKIEDGVHTYFKHYEQLCGDEAPCCPTLRRLLEFERDLNVHTRLPFLRDKSAASGILWTKRQLHYQTSLFDNIFQVHHAFKTTRDGVAAAYMEVYDSYHGWAVKKVFAHSFGGSPPLEAILRQMRPDSTIITGRNTKDLSCPLSEVSEDSGSLDNEFLAAMEDFGKEAVRKWEEFLRFFNCVDRDDDQKDRANNIIISNESHQEMTGFDPAYLAPVHESLSFDDSGICIDDDDKVNPMEEARIGSLEFVKELRPMLEDISSLIQDFNMNDPSKV